MTDAMRDETRRAQLLILQRISAMVALPPPAEIHTATMANEIHTLSLAVSQLEYFLRENNDA